jgi:hypothetical protein
MCSKILFPIELLVVATIFYLDWIGLLPVSKTPYLFILGWISLRIRVCAGKMSVSTASSRS